MVKIEKERGRRERLREKRIPCREMDGGHNRHGDRQWAKMD